MTREEVLRWLRQEAQIAASIGPVGDAVRDRDALRAVADMLEAGERHEKAVADFIRSNFAKHYECDDCWYSCPKSEGCCNDEKPTRCTCGKDRADAALAAYDKDADPPARG
jgi:hypothetical protein